MQRPRALYMTTLVIWSETDPKTWDNAHLGRESDEGEAWCEKRTTKKIDDPDDFPQTDFFTHED